MTLKDEIFAVKDGKLVEYTGQGKKVIIPDGITVIGEEAFKESQIESVIMPDSVTIIDKRAFDFCAKLESVKFSANLVAIKDYAFSGCSKLKEINLPNGLKSLGSSAFSYCWSLTEVVIPDSVKSAGCDCFATCRNLEKVTISKGLTKIPGSMFSQCEKLDNVVIPDTVQAMGHSVFSECFSLQKVVLPKNIKTIGGYTFNECENLKYVYIPDCVETIEEKAFTKCENLQVVTIPDSVETIKEKAFSQCTMLQAILMGKNVDSIYHDAFHDADDLKFMFVPQSAIRGLYSVPYGVKRVVVPVDSVRDIAIYLKENPVEGFDSSILDENNSDPSLSDFIIVKGELIKYLGKGSNIVIPEGVIKIRNEAILGDNIKSVTLPKSLKTIGWWNFHSDIDVHIDLEAYLNMDYCGGNERKLLVDGQPIKVLRVPDGAKAIPNSAFNDCETLEEVYIPSSVEKIGDYAFAGCNNLKIVHIDEGLKSIGEHAFETCDNLERVYIPSTVEEIGGYAFRDCESLNAVYIEDVDEWCHIDFGENNVYGFYANPLHRAHNLYVNGRLAEKLVIGTGWIKHDAFYGCTCIKELVLTGDVWDYTMTSFEGCKNIKKVYGYAKGDAKYLAGHVQAEFELLEDE